MSLIQAGKQLIWEPPWLAVSLCISLCYCCLSYWGAEKTKVFMMTFLPYLVEKVDNGRTYKLLRFEVCNFQNSLF